MALISVRFRKNMVARFSRFSRIQVKPASQNLGGGGGAPSRLAWVHSPVLDLSARGLFGDQQSKVSEWGGCILLTPFAVLTLRLYSVYL